MIRSGTMNGIADQDPNVQPRTQSRLMRRSRSVNGVARSLRNSAIRLSPMRRSDPVRPKLLGDGDDLLKEKGSLGGLSFQTADATSSSSSASSQSNKSSHHSLALSVELIQGEYLAACDRNMFGKLTSSDPYVIASILCEDQEEIVIGQTKHVKATLNPKWNVTLSKEMAPGTLKKDDYTLQLKLMDYDLFGDDTCMGIVKIPMKLDNVSKSATWYDVPKDSATNAKGRIQVAIEAKVELDTKQALLTQGKRSTSQIHLLEKIGEEDTKKNNNNKSKPDMKRSTSSLLGVKSSMSMFGGSNKNEQFTSSSNTTKTTTSSMMGGTANMFLEAGTAVANTTTAMGNVVASTAMEGANMATAASNTMGSTMMAMMAPTSLSLFGRTKATNKTQEFADDQYQNVYKDQACLCLQLTVHAGDGLVAKDRNAMGIKVSSDPYVVVEVWPKGIPPDDKQSREYPKLKFGRTNTVRKNLSPIWEHTFEPFNVPLEDMDMEEAQLRIRILDDDFGIGDDDPMGSIDIFLQPTKSLDVTQKWYHVSATSASRASGRILLSLTTLQAKQSIVVGRKKIEKKDKTKEETTSKLKEAFAKSRSEPFALAEEDLDDIDEEKEDPLTGASMPARYASLDDLRSSSNMDSSAVLLAADNRRIAPKRDRLRKAVSTREDFKRHNSTNKGDEPSKRNTLTKGRSRRYSTSASERRSSRRHSTGYKPTEEGGKNRVRRLQTIPAEGATSTSNLPQRSPRISRQIVSATTTSSSAKDKEEAKREARYHRKDSDERKHRAKSGRSRPSRTKDIAMKDESSSSQRERSADPAANNKESRGEKKRMTKSASCQGLLSRATEESGKKRMSRSSRVGGFSRRHHRDGDDSKRHHDDKRRRESKKKPSSRRTSGESDNKSPRRSSSKPGLRRNGTRDRERKSRSSKDKDTSSRSSEFLSSSELLPELKTMKEDKDQRTSSNSSAIPAF